MARQRKELPHNFPDRAMRDALLHPDNLRALLRAVASEIADLLDYSRLERVVQPYFLDDWRSRECDVMVRLPFRDAAGQRELLICILVEHQSDADPAMPLRLLVYSVFYWEQEWKAWEEGHERGEPLRLTPIVPIVLHTGQQPWDSNRSLVDLFDVPAELQSWLPRWMMPLWDLPEHPTEELTQSEDGFWQALAVVRAERAPPEEFLATLRESLSRLESLGTELPMRWHQLMRMVLHWALFRRPRRDHERVLETARDSHANVQLQTEIETMSVQAEKTWEEEIIEQLREERARGMATALRSTLQTLLQQRFQTIPQELSQRIAAATIEQLQTALASVLTIQSPEELAF